MKNRREKQTDALKKGFFRRICRVGSLVAAMLMCMNLWSYASAQEKTVTLDVRDKALKEVLGMVREQTDVRFIYSEVELQKATPVTVKFANSPLSDAMNRVLSGQPFYG